MFSLENRNVLVIGLGASGVAATELLLSRGADVSALDSADNKSLREKAMKLRNRGAHVELGALKVPGREFDFTVVSPGVALNHALVTEVRGRNIPLIGELELGFQQSLALNISITGTNGKTTTTELVERLLSQNGMKTVAAGNIGTPLCAVADQTRSLDFVTLEVSSFQLETIQFFRPAIAVLMNITPDHLDRYTNMDDYARAKARIFENQQAFDWAIIQNEALAQLKKLGANIPSKIITFSAADNTGDFYLERGRIMSRMEHWSGSLLAMADVPLHGPHNAENIMAVLAIARVLHLPLEGTIDAIKSYRPAPHRCEFVAEIDGVRFINDSKATNVDAVAKALIAMPHDDHSREPNVWLLAGGKDKGFDYNDLGPLLSQRVKGAFIFGETSEKIRAAWGLFTPCVVVSSLLEAIAAAAKRAERGDVVLLSPACSSFDQFRNYQHRGEVFRQAVKQLEISGHQDHGGGSARKRGVPAEALMS